MRIDQIGLLHSAGGISQACIVPGTAPGKWSLVFRRNNGESEPLTAQRSNVRQFSSIDSAWKVLVTLGFTDAQLDWNGLQPEPDEG